MKLFRHYKQKYYKLHGLAKHSEDLSDYAYYECLYDNPGGQFWVRPSELFFGTMELNGKTIRRFEEVAFTFQETTEINETEINIIAPIMEKVFGEWDPQWFNDHAQTKTQFYLVKALLDNKVIGFKIGHKDDEDTFYSWLGGILPDYQRLGVASELMSIQHEWCAQNGYKKVRTKTQNRFKGMLHLNLKFGFEIVGTRQSKDKGGLKIVLEKNLPGLDSRHNNETESCISPALE